ncbi:MAG: hypothetical protein K6F79_04915 [Saccharofermentans sp.]|nr:hypothetical protein [Saccharofermentans sp.]
MRSIYKESSFEGSYYKTIRKAIAKQCTTTGPAYENMMGMLGIYGKKENAAHNSNDDNPEAVNRAIDSFLNRINDY